MNNEDTPSDEQMAKCFGKYRRCSRNCRLKEICLDKYREQQDEISRRKFRQTRYIDAMDDEGDHVSADIIEDGDTGSARYSEQELLRAVDDLDVSDKCRRELYRAIRTQTEVESVEEAKREMLRRLGEIYINDPTGFEVMFFQILSGGNQAALARIRGCSKQNINKIVAKGKVRLAAYRHAVQLKPGCRLSFRELAVYHAVEICGLTYRQTENLLGVAHGIVSRCLQKISAKGVKVSKKRPGRRKRNKKRNTPDCRLT